MSGDPPGATGTGADAEELRYFQALEEAFIRLRGAPLLLSPADWRVAQRWRGAGIPLEFAITAMTEVFARRRERGAEDRVSSLRYCARAVEAAWRRTAELRGPVERADEPSIDVGSRLRGLAGAIPAALPGVEELALRVRSLTGDAAAIEAALVDIDAAMLVAAEAGLDAAAAADLDAWVSRRLQPLEARFGPEELARAADRLRARELRRRAGLPLLSLFSSDAG